MPDTEDSQSGYDVGYRRPPRNRQYQKGQSGNPKGRPKGSRNFSSLIDKELEQKVTIHENGQRKRISKKEAIAKQLVNKAASGDYKAIPILLGEERLRDPAARPDSQTSLPTEDQRVLKNLIARIHESKPANGSDDSGAPSPSAKENGPCEGSHEPHDDG